MEVTRSASRKRARSSSTFGRFVDEIIRAPVERLNDDVAIVR